MPQESNSVSLHSSVKDQYGLPVAAVHYEEHPNDRAMRQHAWEASTKVYEAAGATSVHTRMHV